MQLKTKEQIVQELNTAIFLLRNDEPTAADWICAVDLVDNALPDLVLTKRAAVVKYKAEVSNVQG